MLTFEEKTAFLIEILNKDSENYADSFKTDILNFIGELSSTNPLLKFIYPLNTEIDIQNFVDFLTGKIVMNEHQAGTHDIILDYIN